MDLISVIVPAYNVENYVKKSIESILNQTYENLEVIVIDDGSTDCTASICDQLATKDSRVNVIHQVNGGISHARNVGLKNANGKYIAFVDSDDCIHSEYLSSLYHLLQKYNADIAICNYEKGSDYVFQDDVTEKINLYSSKEMLSQWHSDYKDLETIVWNKLYKSEIFTNHNIKFSEGYVHEDVMISHLLVCAATKIVITNKKLYYYYQREDSIIHTSGKTTQKNYLYSQKKRKEFFKKNGYKKSYQRLQKKYIKDYIKVFLNMY